MAQPLVDIRDVVKRFGPGAEPALKSLSIQVQGGRITGLVGPDGAGKTTLIRLVTGLLVPDQGSISVLGYDSRTQAAAIHRAVGYMPQRFGLYEDLTVQENLKLYADLRGLPQQGRAAVFGELLEFTDLKRFTTRLAGKLSGGMKQKLGLACALIRTPDLLLLDEPSVGVDPISRRELWNMVQALTERGMGVIWSTAYLDEAERCRSVMLLNEGELLFSGPPQQLTGEVGGRVVRVGGLRAGKREVLAEALALDGVIDGVIQGRGVRLVFAEGGAGAGREAVAGLVRRFERGVTLDDTEPRFEDAFIARLGGGPGGHSALAARMRELDNDSAGGHVIKAQGLTKRFGDFSPALNMSFRIPRGEIFGLLGPNGAGKSTTFKMLCGLLSPTVGEAHVAGYDLRRARADARNRLGYMAQKFSLYGDLGVAQNLAFFASVYGLSGARKRRQIDAMIETFDLKSRLRTSARDLPLGYKQRLALACAVMHEPEALFLDEPTSGADPITRREFWSHINGLVEKGVAELVTTHFMEEAEYCVRIALVYRGRNIAQGTPDQLKASAAAGGNADPSLEDAFIALVQSFDADREDAA